MTWLALWLCLAHAGEVRDFRQELDLGVWINWSTLQVEAEARAVVRGASTFKSAEAEARRVLGPRLADAARQVQVDEVFSLGQLEGSATMGESIATRLARWSVGEARYHASGRIELLGQLPLSEALKPWTLSSAEEAPMNPNEPAYTGLVIDARGAKLVPTWSVQLVSPDGSVLWSGALWEDVAFERSPVVYVPDAAHPAAARAGDHPMFLRAQDSEAGVLTLSDEDAVKVRTAFSRSRVLGDGTVVIVATVP